MRVSVIIPSFNHARYIGERLSSVLGQTFRDIEVIILDDGSTDGTAAIEREWAGRDSRITRVEIGAQNTGRVFEQWRRGISLASGELVWIAESDDRSEPTFLERLVREFDAAPGLALAFCPSWLFADDGRRWTADEPGLMPRRYASREFIARFMSRGCPMLNASACLFRRSAWQEIDESYTTFRAAGDRMFWTLIAEKGEVSVVAERLNWYRKHSSNVTATSFLKGINQREAYRILSYIRSRGYITSSDFRRLRRHYLRHFVFELLADRSTQLSVFRAWHLPPRLTWLAFKAGAWVRHAQGKVITKIKDRPWQRVRHIPIVIFS